MFASIHILSVYLLAYFTSWFGSQPVTGTRTRHRSQSRRFRDDRRMRAHLARSASYPADHDGVKNALPEHGIGQDGCATDAMILDPDCLGREPIVGLAPVPVVPLTTQPLFRFIYEATISDASTFGVYCRTWLCGVEDGPKLGRHRDIFPLPLMKSVPLSSSCEVGADPVLKMCNLTILALNFVWDDCPSVPKRPVGGRCNSAQIEVHGNVLKSVLRMFDRLDNGVAKQWSEKGLNKHPELISSRVEMCPTACTCDSMAFVSEALRDSITADDGLFRGVCGHRSNVPRFSSGHRDEYAAVTLRGLRSGKLRLLPDVSAGGSIFVVPKASGDCGRCGTAATFPVWPQLHQNRDTNRRPHVFWTLRRRLLARCIFRSAMLSLTSTAYQHRHVSASGLQDRRYTRVSS